MNYIEDIPTIKEDLYTIEELQFKLKPLIGLKFSLSGKIRTDGCNLRKLIANQLGIICEGKRKSNKSFNFDNKGFPKLKNQLLYTYIATIPCKNNCYNLQMWNFDFNKLSEPIITDINNNPVMLYSDVRIAIVWIDKSDETIKEISIFSPEEILNNFKVGKKQTIKNQAIISSKIKDSLKNKYNHIFIDNYSKSDKDNLIHNEIIGGAPFNIFKGKKNLLTLSYLSNIISNIIGTKIEESDVRSMGRQVEKLILKSMGYTIREGQSLNGSYPDIPHQLLEIKLQNKNTIDLGKFIPTDKDKITNSDYSPNEVRYCIVITNDDNVITDIMLVNGCNFDKYFKIVQSQNFKVQCKISYE